MQFVKEVTISLEKNRSSAEEIVHSFITSNIDYCNALLYGVSQCVINKLQKF